MGPRHSLFALALACAAGWLIGCGKSENHPQADAGPAPKTPVQMSIPSGDQRVVLGVDNLKAEIDKAGAGIKLVKIDLTPAELPMTMDAPEGAKVNKDPLDVQIIAGDRFALRILPGKRGLANKRRQLAGQTILVDQKDLIFGESSVLLTASCEFSKHIVVGYQDFCVESIDNVEGRQVNHSQADCLLMLKCLGSLAPKTPPPADPVAALRQLKAVVTKGADGRVTDLRLDGHATSDATLTLLPKIAALQRLNLHGSSISDEGIVHLAGITGLKDLNLSDCEFTDAGLSALAGLTNLEALNLASYFGDSPQIKGPGLAALAGLTKLQVLILDNNLVDDSGLPHLKNLKALRELHLQQTRVTGDGLANLKDLSNLTLLSLNFTKVTDAGLEGLQGLAGLEVLDLCGTLVNGPGIKHLQGLKKLHSLNLASTPLDDAGLANLTGLAGLKRLVLEGTAVSDAGLEMLKSMKGLKQMSLVRTKVTKAGVDKLKAALPGADITY